MSFLTGTLITWLGQACFVITTLSGAHILIDPVNPAVGYDVKPHSIDASVVFVSHNHFDHNWVEMAKSADHVVQPMTTPGYQDVTLTYTLKGKNESVAARRIFSYHDPEEGRLRGTNTITVINVDGLRICHLGDLGQMALTPKQVELIGHVDILMIPVGGFYTIDAKQAADVTEQLHPKLIFPMHYQTSHLEADLRAKLHPVDEFVVAMRGKATLVTGDAARFPISKDRLPATPEVVVLKI